MKSSLAYYKKIFSGISAGDLAPLYLLKGSEPYIMDEMADRIARKTVADDMRSFNLLVEYGGDVDMNAFITAARSFPFLSDRRVLVLREIERMRGGWKELIEYCTHPVSSSVVVMLRNSHDAYGRRVRAPRNLTALESAVRSRGAVLEFEKLPEKEVQLWVKQKAGRLGMSLQKGVAELLVNSVGDTDIEDR
jgi:DNA polymerase-3 subunit delta